MIHDIKETTELLTAGAALYREIARTGGGSAFRIAVALADDVPVLVAGLHGAHQVPAELADLTEEESLQLQQQLAATFIEAGSNPLVAEAIKASAAATLAGVVAVRKWREAVAPPVDQSPPEEPAAPPVPTEEVPA